MSSTCGASIGGGESGEPVASAAQPVASAPSLSAVLIKVGDGRWRTVEFDVMTLNEGTLLKALKHDDAFEVELRNVPLTKCTVTVLASASDESPSADEERGAKELKGARTLGALTGGMLTVALPYLYIRVALPAHAAGITLDSLSAVLRDVVAPLRTRLDDLISSQL